MVSNCKKDEYYIASVRCYQMKYFSGIIAIEENEEAWLGVSDSYPQCFRNKDKAFKFESIKEIKVRVNEWDGMPWYFRLKPETLRIFKIIKTTIEECTEEEINHV